ncbi:Iron-sulfur flavoprotein [Pyrodictium delaneyi]|uniref:Iron-sulfur flavoprotein n=1 Tax=Pyrodictium delaneyi TaxID=1273541 RepID=A0A0P0N108_9CREN|nr:flavodoxin family protein [Pyrodictium delaneyi]ALL00212.1 Iron-sulfur flavoprotein [Pyrodictium delaneyi]OWJ54296.1 hypothetical protein Pdsh_07360 [Pyrodictium delaneyi]
MGSVKVLGVNGSPRKYGNTFKMLWLALRGADDLGAETRLIHLYDYHLEPCMACYSDNLYECHFPKACPLYERGDKFRELAEAVLWADAIVFATPVYWFMASGKLKTFIDRLTALENMIYHTGRSLLDGKVAGVIAAGEEAGAANALSWMLLTLNMMGFHVPAWGAAYYHGRGDVLENEQATLDAYNVGVAVVRLVKALRGEHAGSEPWYRLDVRERVADLVEELRKIAEEEKEKARETRPWLL